MICRRSARRFAAPIVIFSYANPMLRMGAGARLPTARRDAGVDGVLVLDLPIEEAGEFRDTLARGGHRYNFPAQPDDDRRADSRRRRSLAAAFCTAISRLGVTGARDQVAAGAEAMVQRIRDAHDAADRARVRHLAARSTCARSGSGPTPRSSAARSSTSSPRQGGSPDLIDTRRGVCALAEGALPRIDELREPTST